MPCPLVQGCFKPRHRGSAKSADTKTPVPIPSPQALSSLTAPVPQSAQQKGNSKGSRNSSSSKPNLFSWGNQRLKQIPTGTVQKKVPPVLAQNPSVQHTTSLHRAGMQAGKMEELKKDEGRVISDRPRTVLCMHFSWQNAVDG